jgi:hypothetical protein
MTKGLFVTLNSDTGFFSLYPAQLEPLFSCIRDYFTIHNYKERLNPLKFENTGAVLPSSRDGRRATRVIKLIF